MKFIPCAIPEVLLIKPVVNLDDRGFFTETYREDEFVKAGISLSFVQQNHLRSARGVLRGLHYQLPHAQGKLLRVTSGELYDVAVDLRQNSPSFGQWVGNHITSDNKLQIWVPPGFAHGIYILSEFAEIFYQTTDYYHPENKHTIRWDDPDLGITWPLLDEGLVILSDGDHNATGFRTAHKYIG